MRRDVDPELWIADDSGMPASLFWGRRIRTLIPYAFLTEAIPAQATVHHAVHPAALRAIRCRRMDGAFTWFPFSEPPFRQLLVLFEAIGFQLYIG